MPLLPFPTFTSPSSTHTLYLHTFPSRQGKPKVKHSALEGTSSLWRRRYAEHTAEQTPMWERTPRAQSREEQEEDDAVEDEDARARLAHGAKLRHELRAHPLRLLQARHV